MKINGVRFELDSGAFITVSATNYCILECVDGSLRIEDRIHNNGGWRLARKYTYQQVMDMISGEDKMKKYSVCIDYTASVIYEVEAANPEAAEAEAMRKAAEVAPYDELCITVGYVDEVEDA
jgi:hypothetical protein